jgi:hypothetical protein
MRRSHQVLDATFGLCASGPISWRFALCIPAATSCFGSLIPPMSFCLLVTRGPGVGEVECHQHIVSDRTSCCHAIPAARTYVPSCVLGFSLCIGSTAHQSDHGQREGYGYTSP